MTLAAVLPDADGLDVLIGLMPRNSANAFEYYQRYFLFEGSKNGAKAFFLPRNAAAALDSILERTGSYRESLSQTGLAAHPEIDLEYRKAGRKSRELEATHRKGARTFKQELPAKGNGLLQRAKDRPGAEWEPR